MNIGFVPEANAFIEVDGRPARIIYASDKSFLVEYFRTEWRNIQGLIGQIWEIFSDVVGYDDFVKTSGGRWRHKNRTLKSYGTHYYEYNLPKFSDGINPAGLIFIKFGEVVHDWSDWERRHKGLT